MERIAVIGSGYVGLVTGAVMAASGNIVISVDKDEKKIEDLKKGIIPIYEPELDEWVRKGVEMHNLTFTTDLKEAVLRSKVIFIAVGTPPNEDGSADLSAVEEVARSIAPFLKYENKYIVDKSTVPVGTARRVKAWIEDEATKHNLPKPKFDVVSNPEFLREGNAIYDFTHPDRVIIGTDSIEASWTVKSIYRSIYRYVTPLPWEDYNQIFYVFYPEEYGKVNFIETDLESAEMIKYAANAFLATKITYMNQIAALCEKVGANIKDVAKALGEDTRIGKGCLNAGAGYGGSCFPKDTKALSKLAKEAGVSLSIVDTAIEANEKQKHLMVEKIVKAFGGKDKIKGLIFAVFGLAFKPGTDDMREAPSLVILNELYKLGATFRACDPVAIKEAKWRLANLGDAIEYFESPYQCVPGSDAILLLTEWEEYSSLDMQEIKKSLKGKHFFDFRNVYDAKKMIQEGFLYEGVGVKPSLDN